MIVEGTGSMARRDPTRAMTGRAKGSVAWLAPLLCVLAIAPAWAQQSKPGYRLIDIDIPAGFEPDGERMVEAVTALQSESHLGGVPFSGAVEVHLRQAGPVTLFLTSVASTEKMAYPDTAIQAEFERLRTTPERGAMSADEVETISWKTELINGGARADLHWRHRVNGTETHARALAFRVQSGHLHYAQAECIHPVDEDSNAALSALCNQVLASMAIPSGGADPKPAEPAVTGAALVGAPGAASDPVSGDRAPRTREPGPPELTLRDPSELGRAPLPALPIDKPEKRDYRQILILLGGILLIVGFYLTTRSRNAAIAAASERDADQTATKEPS